MSRGRAAPEGAVGLLHPGEMGAAVGAALRERGLQVLWLPRGRSPATGARAEAAQLTPAGSLAELVRASSVVLSICPPEFARRVAAEVAAAGFSGLYVDANAVSPETARAIEAELLGGGAGFVDGAIIGGPPEPGGETRLYLSGAQAATAAALLRGSDRLEAVVLDGPVGTASALKMCYAAWTKGGTALLLATRAAASAMGVEAALLAEWELSQAELAERVSRAARFSSRKAWRFVAEMEEIAASMEAAGLPDGFHRGAAELYGRLAVFKEGPRPSIEEVVAALLQGRPGPEQPRGPEPV